MIAPAPGMRAVFSAAIPAVRPRVSFGAEAAIAVAMTDAPALPRLTSLAHGGGCGCKIAPAVLQDILARTPAAGAFANLMVGTETSDDAAVWRLNDHQALVATTDFFMPVVDDPYDFGRIAATNALSDVYAMGGAPILALAIVGMPVDRLPAETIARILAGGAAACATAGVPVAGGHSIDSVEPIYGLVALGLVHPDRVLTNRGAREGDVLILTKSCVAGWPPDGGPVDGLGPGELPRTGGCHHPAGRYTASIHPRPSVSPRLNRVASVRRARSGVGGVAVAKVPRRLGSQRRSEPAVPTHGRRLGVEGNDRAERPGTPGQGHHAFPLPQLPAVEEHRRTPQRTAGVEVLAGLRR